MNVCIVTVYNSINDGSYWQARTLGDKLKEMGYNVSYYRNPDRVRILLDEMRRALTFVFHRKLMEGIRHILSVKEFLFAQRYFKIMRKEMPGNKVDCYILGSDTIWNLNDQYFRKRAYIYWGLKFSGGKIYSYAASVSNTQPELVLSEAEYKEALYRFNGIAVRDAYTKSIVESLGIKNAEVVCDPTLLFPIDYYKKLTNGLKIKCESKYILVYVYNKLSSKHEKELLSFSRDNGLKIVSAYGRRNVEYADKVLIDDPFVFMRYFINADYVVTDTFHGTIFSINFKKKFCVINEDKIPVNDAMKEYGLCDRLIDESDSLYERINTNIPVSLIEKVQENRERSLTYLKSCMN